MNSLNFFFVAIVAILAIVAIAMLLVFRSRAKIDLKGPGGTGLKMDASNEPTPPTPAIKVKDATSEAGNVKVADKTGRGVEAETIRGKKGVTITSEAPAEKPGPKA